MYWAKHFFFCKCKIHTCFAFEFMQDTTHVKHNFRGKINIMYCFPGTCFWLFCALARGHVHSLYPSKKLVSVSVRNNYLSNYGKFHWLFIKLASWNKIAVLWNCHWLLLAQWRWHPRNFTKESWQIFSLENSFTSGEGKVANKYIGASTSTQTRTQGLKISI